jgi:hypothetical protein
VNGLRSYLRWPLLTSPRLAAFPSPLTLEERAISARGSTSGCADRRWPWSTAIERSLKHVAKEDRRYEVPDPLGLQDYLARPDLLCQLAAARGAAADLSGWQSSAYRWFPYPKAVGGYRKMMTTADIVDRIVYRMLAVMAAAVTDPHLSARVFGNRLERPGAWSLRVPALAWRQYMTHQVSSLDRHGWAYTCISDLSGFYLAIDTALLCASLRRRRVDELVASGLERLMRNWQEGGELSGLPIGGEASGVLGNAYLISVDSLLSVCVQDYAMYGDDFVFFDTVTSRGRAVLAALDEHLATGLRLRRNIAKTVEKFDPVQAIEHIPAGAIRLSRRLLLGLWLRSSGGG